jgi:hypothetical protein
VETGTDAPTELKVLRWRCGLGSHRFPWKPEAPARETAPRARNTRENPVVHRSRSSAQHRRDLADGGAQVDDAVFDRAHGLTCPP